MKQLIFTLFLAVILLQAKANNDISIVAPQSLLDTSITSITIKDVQQLLTEACGCNVSFNNANAGIVLKLPTIDERTAGQLNRFARKANFPYRNYPEHNYSWHSSVQGTQTVLELTATSLQGVSFGLYGLLQEKLGFSFYHARRTLIPHWDKWPVRSTFNWQATALFDKSGFHLHTEHPLELTEQLLDPTVPHALEDVKTYIDWLVRNGQDYFEFCLLENVNLKTWPAHAKAFVDYAHQRGIMAGVDLSLHMIQQKTFQLYCNPFKSFRTKKDQIVRNLKWLTQADWDIMNMEFSTAEFIAGNMGKKQELRLFIIDWLQKNSHTKLMGRQHVVKPKAGKNINTNTEPDAVAEKLDKERGVMSHTVMFYDMTEPRAPVYENDNQRHMFDFLLRESKVRETWYYPESAYWITFDNSVPVLLLPYLTARLNDIDTCVKYNIPGHLTFSSGWEWGYWLIDWSIARWSWQHSTNSVYEVRTPEMYANQFLATARSKELFQQQLASQQRYLKDSTLMQWMTSSTITDEISIKALSQEYEPRPDWTYKFLRRKADAALIAKLRATVIPGLKAFAADTRIQATNLKGETATAQTDSVKREWTDGIEITGLRASHRSYTLQYTLCKREASLTHIKCNCDSLLNQARAIRSEAQKIVDRRQLHYRYQTSLIATKHWEHTSYHFGYLYPASNLHFWYREEEEARRNKYAPLFLNIYNMFRIAGIID